MKRLFKLRVQLNLLWLPILFIGCHDENGFSSRSQTSLPPQEESPSNGDLGGTQGDTIPGDFEPFTPEEPFDATPNISSPGSQDPGTPLGEDPGALGTKDPGTAGGDEATPLGDLQPGPSDPLGEACTNQDQVQVKIDGFWADQYQQCTGAGQGIWDFSHSKCIEITSEEKQLMEANDFKCSYEGLETALKKLTLTMSPALKKARDEGARLVNCGMRASGKTVIAQWIYLPEANSNACEVTVDPSKILPVTACYRLMENPPQSIVNGTATPEEKEAFLTDCLNLTL